MTNGMQLVNSLLSYEIIPFTMQKFETRITMALPYVNHPLYLLGKIYNPQETQK